MKKLILVITMLVAGNLFAAMNEEPSAAQNDGNQGAGLTLPGVSCDVCTANTSKVDLNAQTTASASAAAEANKATGVGQ